MPLDRPGHLVGTSLVTDDERAAMRQRVEHRVNATEVVQSQKDQGARAPAWRAVPLDQRVEVEERGFGTAGRTRAEHDEPGRAACSQTVQDGRRLPRGQHGVVSWRGVAEVEER